VHLFHFLKFEYIFTNTKIVNEFTIKTLIDIFLFELYFQMKYKNHFYISFEKSLVLYFFINVIGFTLTYSNFAFFPFLSPLIHMILLRDRLMNLLMFYMIN